MGKREPSDCRRKPTGLSLAPVGTLQELVLAAAGRMKARREGGALSSARRLEVVTVLFTSDFSSVLLDRIALKKLF